MNMFDNLMGGLMDAAPVVVPMLWLALIGSGILIGLTFIGWVLRVTKLDNKLHDMFFMGSPDVEEMNSKWLR